MLSLGIVGLPNVGKSTLFNALTRSKQAPAENYPFCTIEPNVGIVEVPDVRLSKLAIVSKSAKTVPTAIQFVDIAGLVKGASEGEGLGNKFLSHIREVDAIVHLVRAFQAGDVIHVHNRVNPKDDADIISLELILADWQTVSRRLALARGKAKGIVAKDLTAEIALLERLDAHLQQGKPARSIEYSDDERHILRDLHLLTAKPVLYVVNTDEPSAAAQSDAPVVVEEGAPHIYISARMEAELAELSREEAAQYLADVGLLESGLDKMIAAGYSLLRLQTFFTSGAPETRAWTVSAGTKGPDAAGVIHTDFIKGYIKADVTKWQDFVAEGGWNGVKEAGKMRLEGREYIVQDGDVCYFHVAT